MFGLPSRLNCFDVARDLHAMLCAAVLESEDRGGNASLRGFARLVEKTSDAN